MAHEDIVKLVGGIPLFAQLEAENLGALADAFRRQRFSRHTIVFQQGQREHTLYVIQKGEGLLLQAGDDGIERRVGRVGPGDVIGASSLLVGDEWPYSLLITSNEAVLYSLDRFRFDQVTAASPSIRDQLDFEERPDIRRRLAARRFSWLREGESTILTTRRHPWAFIKKLIAVLVLMVGLLLLQLALWFVEFPQVNCVRAPALAVALLLPLGLAVFFFLDWRNDHFVVTNQRVVHEERLLLFLGGVTVRQAPLRNVQNVNYNQESMAARALGFGDVVINTAGPEGTLIFDMVPVPALYRDTILERARLADYRRAAERRAEIREEIEARLGGVRLLRQGPEDVDGDDLDTDAESAQRAPPEPEQNLVARALRGLIRYLTPEVRVERGGLVTYRKHWVVLIQDVWQPMAVLTLLTVLLITRLIDAWPAFLAPVQQVVPAPVAVLIYVVLLPIVLFWLWWGYEDWRNDLYQITPTSVIDSKMQPLFFGEKRSLQAPLANIQNVSAETPNIVSRLLRMGTVVLQTAGAEGTLRWQYIYNPFIVAEEVLQRVRAFRMAQDEERDVEQADILSEWFAVYHQTTNPDAHAGRDELRPDHIIEMTEPEPEPEPPEEDDYALI